MQGAAALLAGAMLWGCAADDFEALHPSDGGHAADTQLIVRLAIPKGEAAPATRAVDSKPTNDELQINSLHALIFPAVGDGTAKAVVNRPLMVPSDISDPEASTVTYEFKGFEKDKGYKVYMIANFGHGFNDNITENELKEIILDYTSTLPQAGNLPMVFEPTGESTFHIPAEPTPEPITTDISLKYACVKMKINILFDKDYIISGSKTLGDVYGTRGLRITNVQLNHVSEKSNLITDKSSVSGDRTLKFVGSDATTDLSPAKYYSTWTYEADPSSDTKDQMEPGESTSAPGADSWLWQQVVYLPERYAETGDQLELQLEGELTGAATGTKVLFEEPVKIGVEDGDVAATDLPRGSYYEFIGRVAGMNLEGQELKATVNLKSWDEITLPIDFIHTYLTLDKTGGYDVKSLKNDYIVYTTDGRGGVSFTCDTEVTDKPVVIGTPKTNEDGRTYIELSINPAIDITTVQESQKKGTAKGWITAGNIKKQVTMNYDIAEFFVITPTERVIAYTTGSANETTFTYRTNLGGIRLQDESGTQIFDGNEYTTGGITITMLSGTNADSPTGEIRVKANSQPESTTTYNFVAVPVKKSADYATPISVTVQPPLTGYRIYFRAINDYVVNKLDDATNGFTTEFLSGRNYVLPVESKDNWIDYWNNANSDSRTYRKDHRIYIYNQIGNNSSFTSTQDMAVYEFTKFNGDDANVWMTGDDNNINWFYFDFAKDAKGTWYRDEKIPGTDEEKAATKDYYSAPRPGETLLIFHDNNDDGQTMHRLAYGFEAGVPLAPYSDGESWTVYDPLREPKYTTYDDKPVIEDVTYTIYSDVPMSGWNHVPGKIHKDNKLQNIRYHASQWESSTSNQNVKMSDGKYKNTLHFKAVRGEYDKAIIIKFEAGSGGIGESQLFEGENWTEGTFNSKTGKWTQGKN